MNDFQGNNWTEMEKALLITHLSMGVGFYHHLIFKLQMEFNLDVIGIIDFAYPLNEKGLIYVSNKKTGNEKTK